MSVEQNGNTFTGSPDKKYKWLHYVAELSANDNTVLARVLNKDEPDFLGEVNWILDSNGTFAGSQGVTILHFTDILSQYAGFKVNQCSDVEGYRLPFYAPNYDVQILFNGVFNIYIDFSVKVRGDSFNLIDAHTNTDGKKIYFKFDKDLNDFITKDLNIYIGDFVHVTGASGDDISDSNNTILSIIDGKTLVVEAINNPFVSFGDTPIFNMPSGDFEAYDYGLLNYLPNGFPIKNNVIA